MNAFVKLSASALVLSLALAAPRVRAPTTRPPPPDRKRPAVTRPTIPRYTYKTRGFNRARSTRVVKARAGADPRHPRPDELTKIAAFRSI